MTTAAVGSGLQQRFGPLALHHDKPLSATWWANDGKALLKVYRVVEPLERRNREAQALTLASGWGISTPTVRAAGEEDGFCWTLVNAVGGTAPQLALRGGVEEFVRHTLWLTGVLRDHPALGGPGTGWLPARGGSVTNSAALLQQLSERCQSRPWWPELCQALTNVDDEECVHLHGDIKPEHFLRSGNTVHVVDWEAAARGPVVCDLVDAAFHMVRDLIYDGTSLLPLDVIGQLPVTGPVTAWRLLRWLDRRRPDDLDLLSTRRLRYLVTSPAPATSVRILARLIISLRDAGVPR